ncbi:23S rRNA pseudouridine955/2504/2580 synthase [Variovorax sp. 54]|uniref:RluA family pseudouridine synthase n=1 Tax=Variovorax sp. 54 TaxID=2035212 RepID=UPI000C19DB32|nr:RluA family pseudouridine synthase [Variovorax sp. 54]PIF77235.1 23S rRNA pseudouridine955/2504/2580 synthase [Variovorax sp. 54]
MKNIIGAKKSPTGAPNPADRPAGADTGTPHAAIHFLTVDAESAGQRLDNFLFRHLKGVPKTHVYRIIRSGEVRINKGRVQADTRIEDGDQVRIPPVRISPRAEEGATPPAPAREFPVLLEDEAVLAIDKPAGVAVHGGSGVSFGVIEQLRTARPGAKFLELVHRLDRETSGILLVAKKRSALVALQDQFRERETGKTYLALVEGDWPSNKKVLDAPLAKYLLPDGSGAGAGERRVRVVAKDHPDAMRAVTLVRVLARLTLPGDATPLSLLAVTIKTGRTHQIRVHLASAGHPIAGDDKYGESDRQRALHKLGLKRMFLHAWRLQFNHPASGERIALQAGLPPELHTLMSRAALEAMAQHPTPTAHD